MLVFLGWGQSAPSLSHPLGDIQQWPRTLSGTLSSDRGHFCRHKGKKACSGTQGSGRLRAPWHCPLRPSPWSCPVWTASSAKVEQPCSLGTTEHRGLCVRWSGPVPRRLAIAMCPPPREQAVLHGWWGFFSSQVLHFENVKDVPFGFQTVTSDVNKLSSFYSLKLIKRLYVEKSLNLSTVSGSVELARFSCLPGVTFSHG